MVDLLRILLKLLLENPVCFVTLLSFKSMGDFVAVDGGDEAIGDRTDRFIKVRLCGEDVDCSLRQYGGIVGRELRDCGRVGNGVEWNREDG
jgi:hypothetical protein